MKVETDGVLEAFGKNDQVKKVFWTFFAATAALVLAEMLDPVAAEKMVSDLAGLMP